MEDITSAIRGWWTAVQPLQEDGGAKEEVWGSPQKKEVRLKVDLPQDSSLSAIREFSDLASRGNRLMIG